MIDLVEAVEETPQIDEERIAVTERFREEWLDVAAPYVLCRLKATRSSQQEDAGGLSRFVDQIVLVGSLKVSYKLRDSPKADPLTRPADTSSSGTVPTGSPRTLPGARKTPTVVAREISIFEIDTGSQ